MAHEHCDHSHNHAHSHPTPAGRGLALAFLLNISFAVVELVGGLLTNSVAILSDALHDFGDASALGLAWYLERVSGKKADSAFSYGYRRYSLLSAVITSTVLICGSLFMAWRAVDRLIHPESVNAQGMLLLSILGILVNGLAFKFTHHGHSHNEKAVSLHLLEDVLGWVAVLIASIVMMFVEITWLDPALSLAISSYILWGSVKRIRETSLVFLQRVPANIDLSGVRISLERVAGVERVVDLHVWSTDGQQNIVTLSVRTKPGSPGGSALRAALTEALGELAHHHVTIEVLEGNEPSLGCEST
jgi:cobalt-zinc-cadmium efflux system protein